MTVDELLYSTGLRVPLVRPLLTIASEDPDPGLFGPDSVTWRILRAPLLIVAGGRALLMQAAHPLVAQGAIDFSEYATDPYGRLLRTQEWVATVAFGTTQEAMAICDRVTRMHRHVRGTLPGEHSSDRLPGGAPYSALDRELLRWVHATLVDTLIVAFEGVAGRLSPEERDRCVREWNAVAPLMGLPTELLFSDHHALQSYIDEQIESGIIHPGRGSKLVAGTILRPPLPTALARPIVAPQVFLAVGFCPAKLREAYSIRWTARHQALHDALCRGLRASRHLWPPPLRETPMYSFAMARVLRR